MMKKIFKLWLLIFFGFSTSIFAFDHQHQQWNELMQALVIKMPDGHSNMVDYQKFKQKEEKLDLYLNGLSAIGGTEFENWEKTKRLAFLINAYNAFTIKLILLEYPKLDSIKDLGSFFTSPWEKKVFMLFGRKVYLDEIEHKMIRKKGVYDEPYIHFALVCAAWSCPPLRNEAFVYNKLNQQLEDNLIHFLSDKKRNRFEAKEKSLVISKIFDWYEDDFKAGYKAIHSLKGFFANWAHLLSENKQDRAFIQSQKAEIEYIDYDWQLNDFNRVTNN
jgi:hypothetical protein